MKITEGQLRNIVRKLVSEAYDQSLLLKVEEVAQYALDNIDTWLPLDSDTFEDEYSASSIDTDTTNPIVRKGIMKRFLLTRGCLEDLGVTRAWMDKNFDLVSQKVDQKMSFQMIDDRYDEDFGVD